MCHTVSYAAVKSRKTAPVFRFCWNLLLENSVREVGNCVKGSRIRNPVPPPTAVDSVEDVLLEVLGKLKIV